MGEQGQSSVTFRFTKSLHSRMIRLDGVFGGLTPRADVYGAAYTELPPIPRSVTHSLDGTRLGGETARDTAENDFEREIQVEFTMSLPVARAFRNWLDAKIEDAERLFPSESGENSVP